MKNLFIGIDFSKEKLDVAVITAVGLPGKQHKREC